MENMVLSCMKGIKGVMKNLKGSVKPKQQIAFAGFIVPLEIMAFECIPHLGQKFREVVPAEKDCPRMCKQKFSESCLRGFSLEDINKALESNKDIISILEPDSDEKDLLSRIIADDVDDGIGFIDPVVDSWRERLTVQRKKIWWKDLYELDLGSRHVPENVGHIPENFFQFPENVAASILSLKEVMEKGFEEIREKIDGMDNKITLIDGRVIDLENCMAAKLAEDSYKDRHRTQTETDVYFEVMDVNDGVFHRNMEEINEARDLTDGASPQNMEEINEDDEEHDKEKKKDTETKQKKKKKKKGKKKEDEKKKKEEGTILRTGQKRSRKPSVLVSTPYVRQEPKPKRHKKN